ncbi:hypothetical protein NDU88_005936 [Pleurodeles waltl]|uniref:Reverse transcriptase domain-containing protein n=1 Tax=Pleurodeles waltl TaxID=8319 RepID=A0AAV7VNK0_PLEWA|nr:hypothetical protein NDU88_005936 [Pleurodeles waltl]
MILIIETARELMETLMKEIQSLEEELKTQDSVQEAKKQIETINQELESFNLYLVKRKTDKLRKDIRWFTKERAYPYLLDRYYANQQQNASEQDRQFWTTKKIVTFSDTSESEGEGTSSQFEQYNTEPEKDNKEKFTFLDISVHPTMESIKTFGFSEEDLAKLLDQPRSGSGTSISSNQPKEGWFKLLELKKKTKRTELHADYILEYLRAGIIPAGLRVRNIPCLFVEIRQFLEKWSLISNRCSRDWMILIIETARELMETLMKEIQSLEEELKTQDSVQEAKKQIETINQELESFNLYLVKRKIDKLRKDIRWFTKERAYPYLSDRYYANQQQNASEQDRQFWTTKKIVTFSVTSESEGEGTSNQFEQYNKTGNNWHERVKKEITSISAAALENGIICQQEFQYLNPAKTRTPVFYGVPKIHENKTDPPMRPIDSTIGALTEALSKYVEKFLNPRVALLPAFIRDTSHIIAKLEGLPFNSTTQLLVTMDIDALYTNIPQKEAWLVVARLFEKEGNTEHSSFILQCLNIVLRETFFEFDGQTYQQKKGVSMGAACAPSVANIYVGSFEETHIYNEMAPFYENVHFWSRFIDDIFFIWTAYNYYSDSTFPASLKYPQYGGCARPPNFPAPSRPSGIGNAILQPHKNAHEQRQLTLVSRRGTTERRDRTIGIIMLCSEAEMSGKTIAL